tara:strand:- start:1095 stop:1586 length:492 start_codon:yes stop_codon:yes gene_type:complete
MKSINNNNNNLYVNKIDNRLLFGQLVNLLVCLLTILFMIFINFLVTVYYKGVRFEDNIIDSINKNINKNRNDLSRLILNNLNIKKQKKTLFQKEFINHNLCLMIFLLMVCIALFFINRKYIIYKYYKYNNLVITYFLCTFIFGGSFYLFNLFYSFDKLVINIA